MWLQLKFEVPSEQADHLAELLEKAGSSAVTMQDAADQPLFEPPLGTTPLWNLTWVCGLFEADANMDAVLKQIKNSCADRTLPPHQLNPLEDKDWVRAWMDSFKPMSFGQRLWICPSNHTPPEPDAVNIMLDPGLAFGTGTHPTTAMCLSWLDANPPENKDVIDYGCGSGILAIAACKLGAQKAIAIDNDPQALIATRENAKANQVTDLIQTCLPEDAPTASVDLLLANILAGPLHELAPLLAERVKPQGQIVLSGILQTQADELIQTYSQFFTIQLWRQEEDWVCLSGHRLT
ncbi:MAG: 50S ribosomal protein L11 methyltransferase [Gammaproteobacteria bacterium]|nr:50S ribosomal protein L11 methyltransferase [Gammaproteobacteria bacterium]